MGGARLRRACGTPSSCESSGSPLAPSALARAIAVGRAAGSRADAGRGDRNRAAMGCSRRCARRWPSRCWSPVEDGARVPPCAAARGATRRSAAGRAQGELHLALARAVMSQRPVGARMSRDVEPATTIASSLRGGRRPAGRAAGERSPLVPWRGARGPMPYGEAADLAERALELMAARTHEGRKIARLKSSSTTWTWGHASGRART